MTSFMEFVSSFGDNICLALAGLVSVIFLMKKHRIEAVLFCLVLLMGLILNNTFKLLYQRPRPNISPLVVEHSYSFPSGHAMNSFIFYALLVYFSYHFFHKKSLTILMSIVAVVLVGMIGFSRVYLGVHYFTDVVAGYIAGFWWFITVLLIQHLLIFYKLYKSSE
ncbi:MAG: phosphatase PAP2 family protein [Candidatus Woesebacteria bacterium]